MNNSTYSVVIATRNRQEALTISVPQMLSQSRAPSQIIIVDSSDDHESTKKAVSEATNGCKIPIELIIGPRGASIQRNQGLELVCHPIVFFPDDDSIWYDDTAEEILFAYENDANSQIAAVCGLDYPSPPTESGIATGDSYQLTKADKLRRKIARTRYNFEDKFFPDPARLIGKKFTQKFQQSDWMLKRDIVPVEWMTGFRMSFRTEVIRQNKFCEAFSNYSLFEDIDASFNAWRIGAVVAARKSRVYHHKSPEHRDNGRKLGINQILNKAYIVKKHGADNPKLHKATLRFSNYKTLQYLIACRDNFSKSRYQGAKDANKLIKDILNAPREKIDDAYTNAVKKLNIKGQE